MSIRIEPPHPAMADAMGELFLDIEKSAPDFRPHPMTQEEADRLSVQSAEDFYLLAVDDGWRPKRGFISPRRLLGYGFLRFFVGFERPSLGLAVHSEFRRLGVGRTLMEALHLEAKLRGHREVRLRVRPDNLGARRLYAACGYVFSWEVDREELVGTKALLPHG